MPIVPLLAFRNALLDLQAATARRTLCHAALRNSISEMRLAGYDSIATCRKARFERLSPLGKPSPRLDKAMATISHCRTSWNVQHERGLIHPPANPDMWGPLNEYDERVQNNQLREDEHQRGMVLEAPYSLLC